MADYIAVGGIYLENFISLEGELDDLGVVVQEITRPAADGHAFRAIGLKTSPARLISTVDSQTAELATQTIERYKAMQGSISTIYMRGISHSPYLILNVRPMGRRQVAASSGGLVNGTWIIQCEWTVIYSGAT